MNTSISKTGPIPTRFILEIGKLDLQGRFLPVELLSGLTMAADGHPLCGAAPEESEEHFANRFHRYLLITVKCWGLRWLVHFQDLHGSMLQYYRLFCLFFCFYVLFQFSLSPPHFCDFIHIFISSLACFHLTFHLASYGLQYFDFFFFLISISKIISFSQSFPIWLPHRQIPCRFPCSFSAPSS